MGNTDASVTALLAIASEFGRDVTGGPCLMCKELRGWCSHSSPPAAVQVAKSTQPRVKSSKKNRFANPRLFGENDPRIYLNVGVHKDLSRDNTPPFKHVLDSSEYMREYKSAKSREDWFEDLKTVLHPYEGRTLPTTQIVLNPASALRRSTLVKSRSASKLQEKSSFRSSSSRSLREQFVLCSPSKVVTYDCGSYSVKVNETSRVSEVKKPKSKRKASKKLLDITFDLPLEKFCVTGTNNNSEKPKEPFYIGPFQQSRLAHFPVECPLSKQGTKTRPSMWKLSLSIPEQNCKTPSTENPGPLASQHMYSMYGLVDK